LESLERRRTLAVVARFTTPDGMEMKIMVYLENCSVPLLMIRAAAQEGVVNPALSIYV
jgi:hypothetical protein